MNLSELLKAPGLSIAAACWLFLELAPRVSWLPSELNAPVANIGAVCALVAIVLALLDLIGKVRK